MDIPGSFVGSAVGEGEMYFFTVDCPIGVQDHIHICIKRNNRILLFSTCSSRIETAFRLARLRGLDINTFPVFTRNAVNKFQKEETYVDCNNVIEIGEAEFGQLIKDGKIHRLDGTIDAFGLELIARGVKLSPDVERRIKEWF